MFKALQHKKIVRGNVKLLFAPKRALRYLSSVAVGVPIYFVTAILLTLAPLVTSELHLTGPVTAADALIWGSIGLAVGDLCSGLLSQWLKSRKKAIAVFLFIALCTGIIYTQSVGATPGFIHFLCFVLGTCAGYWAVLVTTAAEQFGTVYRCRLWKPVPSPTDGQRVFGVLSTQLSGAEGSNAVVSRCGVLCGDSISRSEDRPKMRRLDRHQSLRESGALSRDAKDS